MRTALILALVLALPLPALASDGAGSDLARVAAFGNAYVAFRVLVGEDGGEVVLDSQGSYHTIAKWVAGEPALGSFRSPLNVALRGASTPGVAVAPALGMHSVDAYDLGPGEHLLVVAVGADVPGPAAFTLQGSGDVALLGQTAGPARLVGAEDFDGSVTLTQAPGAGGARSIRDATYAIAAGHSLYLSFMGGGPPPFDIGLTTPAGEATPLGGCHPADSPSHCSEWFPWGDLGAGSFTLHVHEAEDANEAPIFALFADVVEP